MHKLLVSLALAFSVTACSHQSVADNQDETVPERPNMQSNYHAPTLCEMDQDCADGAMCLRPAGAFTQKGICGKMIDSYGENVAYAQTRRTVRGCWNDNQCPPYFGCVKLDESGRGACVLK